MITLKNNKPLVSVLMTAFNREKYIAEAMESVLMSYYTNFELIVVDDCSIDNTVQIAKKYEQIDSRVKVYINETNLGDYPNRNKAASYATGKYIKYLDSDDVMYPHCLDVMVRSMEAFPNAGFGLSAKPDIRSKYPVLLTPYEVYLEHFNGFGHFDRAPGSAIINLNAFKEVKGFIAKRWIGDTELWLRLAKSVPLVKFQRDLVWDRQHSSQEAHIERSNENLKLSAHLRGELFKRELYAPDCPLSEDEVTIFMKRDRKNKLKSRVIKSLKNLLTTKN